MKTKKKSARRKDTGRLKKAVSISAAPEEIQLIDRVAKKQKRSRSSFIMLHATLAALKAEEEDNLGEAHDDPY